MARIAVTGGAGFLGSHIVRRLVDEGHEVTVIDDFSSGSTENLADVGVKQKVSRGDLKDLEFARKSLRRAEEVFHFAAEVGSVAYLHGSNAKELATLQANMVIDANVFKAAAEARVSSIYYASSVSVYPIDMQMGSDARFREEDSDARVNPEGGYGWSKFIAEKQLSMMDGVSSGVARIFHAYGKNIYLKPDRSQVIASLMRKAIRYPKEGFVVWGDGRQRRCFVYIDDAVDALFRVRDHVLKKGSLTVNVGSTEEHTVRDVAEKVVELSGKKIPLKFDRSKPSGALNRTPDLGRVRRVLGWGPTTGFSEGMKRTYEWALTRV